MSGAVSACGPRCVSVADVGVDGRRVQTESRLATQVAELGGVGHPDDPQLVVEDPRFQRTERGDPSDRIVASMHSFPVAA